MSDLPVALSSLQVVGGALIFRGRCLVARRAATRSEPLLWEFPGGKLEPGEGPEAALVRELAEELTVEARVIQWLGRGEAASADRHIVLDVYACAVVAGTPRATEHAELRWVRPAEIPELRFAEADVPVLDALVRYLRAGHPS